MSVWHRGVVKYHGKASHAAAYPWEGVNALDAAVLAYNNLSVLRQQMKPDWRLHCECHMDVKSRHGSLTFDLYMHEKYQHICTV